MVSTGSRQQNKAPNRIILPMCGSTGSRARCTPRGVSSSCLSRAFCQGRAQRTQQTCNVQWGQLPWKSHLHRYQPQDPNQAFLFMPATLWCKHHQSKEPAEQTCHDPGTVTNKVLLPPPSSLTPPHPHERKAGGSRGYRGGS